MADLDADLDGDADLYGPDGWAREEDRIFIECQARWYYDRSNMKIAAKSRQIGFTWTTAFEAMEVASLRPGDGGMNVYFMTTSKDDARDFIQLVAEWIVRMSPVMDELVGCSDVMTGDDWFDEDDGERILAFRIDFKSGHSVYALPSRPAKMRGKKRCYAILDEAAQQDVREWITAAGGSIVWGGRLAIISTYFGTDNGFYRLIESVKTGKQEASLHEIDIHRALADGLFKRVCVTNGREWSPEAEREWVETLRGVYGDEAFREEFECIPQKGGGQLIPKETVMRCMTLGPLDCTIIEIEGGKTPRMWVDRAQVEADRLPWDGPDAATPEHIATTIANWLDRHVAGPLERLNLRREPEHFGGDFGRTTNLSAFIFGTRGRDLRRRIGLIIELENVEYPTQDQILDFCWDHMTELAGGCSDANGGGGNSAERAQRRTGGKVKAVRIQAGWHDPQIQAVKDRLTDQSLLLPRDFAPLFDDLQSLRRVGGKIVIPERTTQDERKQRRHGDAAVALALFEQSIDADGPGTLPEPPPPIRLRPRVRPGVPLR